jgi:8-oxo-dGTP pyrophosphatase MutT (NUDIX family)
MSRAHVENEQMEQPNLQTSDIEHDDWKWLIIQEVKELDNSKIPNYLLKKALEIAQNETNS